MKLTEYLKHFIGRPYIWAGNGSGESAGFDCSGLVLEGLWALGLYSGKDVSAQDLYNSLRAAGWAPVPRFLESDCDILFFGKSTSKLTHVAVALNSELMLEASGGGSKCKTLKTSTGFVRVRPIRSRKDLVAAFRSI